MPNGLATLVMMFHRRHARGPPCPAGRGARAGARAYWSDHRHRDGRVRGIRHGLDARVVTGNEAQFGFFGVALALVTWFSGAAICVLIGACAGPVLAEDTRRVGRLVRGGESGTLTAGARPPLPPPARELGLRDAFRNTEGS
jgi:hypothetical protein